MLFLYFMLGCVSVVFIVVLAILIVYLIQFLKEVSK